MKGCALYIHDNGVGHPYLGKAFRKNDLLYLSSSLSQALGRFLCVTASLFVSMFKEEPAYQTDARSSVRSI